MATYEARIIGGRGGVRSVDVEASNLKEASSQASRYGRVVSIKKKGGSAATKMGFADRQVFMSRLAAMLASGVGASDALKLLRTTFGGSVRKVSAQLERMVEQGDDLPHAISKLDRRIIPSATAAMIQAGSHSGATHEALKGAMNFERTMERVRKESGKGLKQAIGGFLVAGGFILGTVFGFLPKVMNSDMMKMGGTNDNMMEWTINATYAVGYLMGLIGVIFLIMVLMSTVGRRIAPVTVDRIILKIPIYKDLVLAKNNFVAFHGLSLLVNTGVSMEAAFDLMADSTSPGALRQDFMNAKKAVQRGQPWTNAMRSLEATDRAALGASLDRSQIATSMNAISQQYQDIYAQRMASFVPVMQGISALFLMISGLIMFGVTIVPMLKMSTSILTH